MYMASHILSYYPFIPSLLLSLFILLICSSLILGACLMFLLLPAKISFIEPAILPSVFTPSRPPRKLITWSGRYACKANAAATMVVQLLA